MPTNAKPDWAALRRLTNEYRRRSGYALRGMFIETDWVEIFIEALVNQNEAFADKVIEKANLEDGNRKDWTFEGVADAIERICDLSESFKWNKASYVKPTKEPQQATNLGKRQLTTEEEEEFCEVFNRLSLPITIESVQQQLRALKRY